MKETKDSQEYFNNISNLKYSKLKKYQVDEGKLSSSLSSTINNNINNNNNNNNNSYSSEQLQINKLEQEAEKTVNHMQKDSNSLADPNDRATQESEFGLELRTRDRERKLIRKIHSSLIKIDDGTFGYCEETGEEIGLQRLEARPVASLTLEAQERREITEKQYTDSR